jgi:hypothetical protein
MTLRPSERARTLSSNATVTASALASVGAARRPRLRVCPRPTWKIFSVAYPWHRSRKPKRAIVGPERATKVRTLLDLLETSYSVNNLYTGFGSTKSEAGQLEAREVMVVPNGTGLKLTPTNHTRVNIGH